MADRRLQVFHAVAKHLSFTKAAESLFMTQPAVTAQVRQLEEHFNTRLFDRTRGRIALTSAGKLALEYAEKILNTTAELDQRLHEIGGKLSGPLLIGASTTLADYLLPKVLGNYKASYPAVVPQLFVNNSGVVQSRVAERALDIGFVETEIHLPSLAADICCKDELLVICAPSHPLANLTSVDAELLTQYPFVSRETGSGTRDVIDNYLRTTGIAPEAMQVMMELGSPEALKGLVATGVGFTIMSSATAINEVQLGQLMQIPLSPRLTRNLYVVYPKERIHSHLVSSFIDFAKQSLLSAQ